jgi:E3 ubiquitin-protein ligase RAD18
VQDWILLYNSNLDTSQPRSLQSLRAKLAETEASRKRDEDKGRLEAVEELKTVEGRSKYAQDKRTEFERLKQDIMDRDKRRKIEEKGAGVDSAIEIE